MSDADLVKRLVRFEGKTCVSSDDEVLAADAIEKKDAALRQALIVLGDMASMMDEGDEHGAGSPWHTDAKDAIAKIKRALGIAQEEGE